MVLSASIIVIVSEAEVSGSRWQWKREIPWLSASTLLREQPSKGKFC